MPHFFFRGRYQHTPLSTNDDLSNNNIAKRRSFRPYNNSNNNYCTPSVGRYGKPDRPRRRRVKNPRPPALEVRGGARGRRRERTATVRTAEANSRLAPLSRAHYAHEPNLTSVVVYGIICVHTISVGTGDSGIWWCVVYSTAAGHSATSPRLRNCCAPGPCRWWTVSIAVFARDPTHPRCWAYSAELTGPDAGHCVSARDRIHDIYGAGRPDTVARHGTAGRRCYDIACVQVDT